MKKLMFTTLTLAACTGYLLAQEIVEKSFPLKPGHTVYLNLKFAKDIKVVTWEKASLLLRSEIDINNGTLNGAHKTDVKMLEGGLQVITGIDREFLQRGAQSDCIGKENSSFYNFNDTINGSQYWICCRLIYTVFVPADVDLKVETVSGNIQVSGLKGPLDARSVSGTVEMQSDADQKADVVLKSVTGDIASDLTIVPSAEKVKTAIGQELMGKLNGGGKTIHLESVSGNIIFSKTK